jgi:hypothetical protein
MTPAEHYVRALECIRKMPNTKESRYSYAWGYLMQIINDGDFYTGEQRKAIMEALTKGIDEVPWR